MSEQQRELTPQQIVDELDRYVIGQHKAKRAVAISLRNRYRRRQLSRELREDIRPKNLLLIGPTGVGKTEIARRIANISGIPFVKVEATKFTEVGYVGRDVDSMVRDLVEVSMSLLRSQKIEQVGPKARERAHEKLLDIIYPEGRRYHPLSGYEKSSGDPGNLPIDIEETDSVSAKRQQLSEELRKGELDEKEVEIDVNEQATPVVEVFSSQTGFEEMGINMQGLQSMLGNMLPSRQRRRRVKVSEAREIMFQEEMHHLIDQEELQKEALCLAQESGVIFLDEIDKIASSFTSKSGPDVSREGVQRDLLPLVEGTSVMTKYGIVKTDHILFFAAGAFNVSKPSDLIPELQGRFPVRVEFDALKVEDFKRILVEPQNALTRQYRALLEVDGLEVEFTTEAIEAIARFAFQANADYENIGARRLHTIMEQLMEEAAFDAPQKLSGSYVIDETRVEKAIAPLLKDHDLARFIL
ncbi:MAG: ATP-dependent hsl protease ATP-binding subunit HslU [Candidatus Rifleibacterium amylolyticum]|nr:MAG: ATP-dependent hsl protease ATP-binding subunit HslU [Candidatus Rifleibacterium amylolyticum]